MFKRLNITLPDDVLARADDYSRAHRYTRSGLIAAALESFVSGDSAAEVALEAPVAYAAGSAVVLAAPATLEEIAPLLRGFFSARDDVEAAWVFGSVARGEAGPMSDVDVAVLLKREVGRTEAGRVTLELMGRLGRVLQRDNVDVVSLEHAPVRLAQAIVTQGAVVFGEDSRARAEAEIRAIAEYEDFRPVFEEQRKLLRERVARNAGL